MSLFVKGEVPVKLTGLDSNTGTLMAACTDAGRAAALIPIDILGMLTDRNPSGLYLAAS